MKPIKFIIAGIAILLLGGIYNAAFLGVPSPDPTPETITVQDTHTTIMGILCGIGFGVFAIGVLLRLKKILKEI